MTPNTLARRDGYRNYRERRAADCLSADEVNQIILEAINRGHGSYSDIQAALAEARAAAVGDGVRFNERNELVGWAY